VGNETRGMLSVPERGFSELLNKPGAVPVGTGTEEFTRGVTPMLGAVDSGGYGIGPVPKSEVRLSVPERGLSELVKEPGGVDSGG
jgi:hypothetical protein